MTYEECFLCGKNSENCLQEVEFIDLTITVPGSKRAVRFVLEHLANCIRAKLLFDNDTIICNFCYYDLADYDKLMVKLLASQKDLTSRLQAVLTSTDKGDQESLENDETDAESTPIEVDDTKTQFDEIEAKPDLMCDDEQPIAVTDIVEDDSDDEDCSTEKDGSVLYEAKLRAPQECVACGENFKSKLLLHKHITENHVIAKVFKCTICGAARKDEENLELHMNVHEGKTEYECRYCPKRFSRPMNTLRHMRKHWDKKGFQCEKCGERFSLDNMLYNHLLRHEAEENPLICSVCNQSFKSRKTFKHHQLTHQKHRPRHQCPLCPKSFTERYTLKMHMTTHDVSKEPEKTENSNEFITDSEDHSCVICDQKFQTKDLLNSHLKDNHNAILQ